MGTYCPEIHTHSDVSSERILNKQKKKQTIKKFVCILEFWALKTKRKTQGESIQSLHIHFFLNLLFEKKLQTAVWITAHR
mmetsp:Transcript_2026/g.3273  ORF Transcript_2026/g.3273 Transcript_2026/m.3273 type:complete len:80 (+) Transcript_2026:280-519(+)